MVLVCRGSCQILALLAKKGLRTCLVHGKSTHCRLKEYAAITVVVSSHQKKNEESCG